MSAFPIALLAQPKSPPATLPADFIPLFNHRDLTGWKTTPVIEKHWSVKDGILEHDGIADDLWTSESFENFTLSLEWRWPDEPKPADFPVFDQDGNERKDRNGKVLTQRVLDAGDSGVFLRGFKKAQANLFCYPCGSGEVWEYRNDPDVPADVRKAVTPRKQADRPLGQWNHMLITLRGDRLTVVLNNEEVISNASLPGIPKSGPIGLQHEHGRIQFRNLAIKPLPGK